jgi:hypothetical protein
VTAPNDLSADRLSSGADNVYAALIAAHEGLDDRQSAALNARLILLLANLVGDADAVIKAIETAKAERQGAQDRHDRTGS